MNTSSIEAELSEQTQRLFNFVRGRTEAQILVSHRRTPGEGYHISYTAYVGEPVPDIQFSREMETGKTPTEAVDKLIERLSKSDYGSEERAKIAERVKELGFRITRY